MAWTDKYMTLAGAGSKNGNDEANAWGIVEAIANVTAGTRVNWKAETASTSNTSYNLSVAGTTTAPIWWRGYKTTIGDMDGEPISTRVAGTDVPHVDFGTAGLTVSGAHQIVSNLSLTAARSASMLVVSGLGARLRRVRSENTSSNAAAVAYSTTTAQGQSFTHCWFKAPATATKMGNPSTTTIHQHCVFEGGIIGVLHDAGNGVYQHCLFLDAAAAGLSLSTTSTIVVADCTFYNAGTDGIRWTALPTTTAHHVSRNIFSGCGGYGLNNNTGTATNLVHRWANLFYGNTSGTEFGFGDSPGDVGSFGGLSDSASPFVNAAGGDFSLDPDSEAVGSGAGLFENRSLTSYLSRGAVQPEAGGALLAAADVKVGVDRGDGVTGTYTGADRWSDPGAANVLAPTAYKADSTSNNQTGTLTLPAAGVVLSTAGTYGAGGTALTGAYVPVSVSDVRSGVAFGDGSAESGTCVVPSAADVEFGVSVDHTTGTFVVPTETQVEDGVSYGSGSEFTGSLVGGGITVTQLTDILDNRNLTAANGAKLGTLTFTGSNLNVNVMDFDATLEDVSLVSDIAVAVRDVSNVTPAPGSLGEDISSMASQVPVLQALDAILVDDGGGSWEFTSGSLANAPTGSGGTVDEAAIASAVWANSTRTITGGTVATLTNPPQDSSGVGTLLSRLTDTRAGKLDFLDAAISSVSTGGVSAGDIATAVANALDATLDGISTQITTVSSATDAINLKTQNLPVNPAAVGSNMGTVTSVTNPVTVGTITDKAGYKLASDGLDTIATTMTGVPDTFVKKLMWLFHEKWRVTRNKTTGQKSVYGSDGSVATVQATTDTDTQQTISAGTIP